MKNKLKILIVILLIILVLFFIYKKNKTKNNFKFETTKPVIMTLYSKVSATGNVEPMNRLELKPQISGRIEKILIKEGDKVRAGEILAWMSSTERASLIDAARAKGKEEEKIWEDIYKPTPIIAPLNGAVIVNNVQPGQTITTSDVAFVLSDKLLVKANIDETDIGKIKIGQNAIITLDAYPEIQIEGKVERIAYESIITNNVTTYKVDIAPIRVPQVFKSGMSASLDIIQSKKENVLTIPLEASLESEHGKYVFILDPETNKPEKRKVKLGDSDDSNVEVISGLEEDDLVITQMQEFKKKNKKEKTNPFMPNMRGGRKK